MALEIFSLSKLIFANIFQVFLDALHFNGRMFKAKNNNNIFVFVFFRVPSAFQLIHNILGRILNEIIFFAILSVVSLITSEEKK